MNMRRILMKTFEGTSRVSPAEISEELPKEFSEKPMKKFSEILLKEFSTDLLKKFLEKLLNTLKSETGARKKRTQPEAQKNN